MSKALDTIREAALVVVAVVGAAAGSLMGWDLLTGDPFSEGIPGAHIILGVWALLWSVGSAGIAGCVLVRRLRA